MRHFTDEGNQRVLEFLVEMNDTEHVAQLKQDIMRQLREDEVLVEIGLWEEVEEPDMHTVEAFCTAQDDHGQERKFTASYDVN